MQNKNVNVVERTTCIHIYYKMLIKDEYTTRWNISDFRKTQMNLRTVTGNKELYQRKFSEGLIFFRGGSWGTRQKIKHCPLAFIPLLKMLR